MATKGIIRLSLLSAIGVAVAATPVAAQSDLLQRGKSLFGQIQGGSSQASISESDIAAGLKEALRIGSERVVGRVGQSDGFNADPKIHIPLPESLNTVRDTLGRVGLSGSLDDLELRLNRAAEDAAPKAQAIFADAISAMTWQDVRDIYEGPDDSATQYLRSQMTNPLKTEMRPVIEESLAQVGAVAAYDRVMSQYRAVPFVPDVKADLVEHALDGGLDGLFIYLAEEEAAIRNQPIKQTTELLRKVFGER